MKSSHINSDVKVIDVTYLKLSSERSRLDLSISVRLRLVSFKMSEKMMVQRYYVFSVLSDYS